MSSASALFLLCLGSLALIFWLVRLAILAEREHRESGFRIRGKLVKLSPGCYRCHGCDSHKCAGTCPGAQADRKGES